MHAPDCPLTRLFKTTPGTFTARDFKRNTSEREPFVKDKATIRGIWPRIVTSNWTIATHQRRIPPRMGRELMFLTWVFEAPREKLDFEEERDIL